MDIGALFGAAPVASQTPQLGAGMLYKQLEKNRAAFETRFDKLPATKKSLEGFKQAMTGIDSPEELLKDRKALKFALETFGLEESINQTGIIKKLLTEDPTSPKALANKFVDQRFSQFAKAMSFLNNADALVTQTKNVTLNALIPAGDKQIAAAPGLGQATNYSDQTWFDANGKSHKVRVEYFPEVNAAKGDTSKVHVRIVELKSGKDAKDPANWQALNGATGVLVNLKSPVDGGKVDGSGLPAPGAIPAANTLYKDPTTGAVYFNFDPPGATGTPPWSDKQRVRVEVLPADGKGGLERRNLTPFAAGPIVQDGKTAAENRAKLTDSLTAKWKTVAFEKWLGDQNPAVREATYFKRTIGALLPKEGDSKEAKESQKNWVMKIMGDKVLMKVMRETLQLPDKFSALEVEQQDRLLRQKIKPENFKTEAALNKFIDKFIMFTDMEANKAPSMSQQLFGGGGGLLNLMV